eukprot:gnl/MRDRNA2_/MRDRNA2_86648_c1_seq1.p1 gnl/MRDRNA2_/MRDRNA2_86648_c1~~gnl/MRDRNA2_/MRDRNA2_86648_c1_seq1.p1  ORF type:complete len:219 (+),score=40.20 gnl/MRDRNA2_/MRDRNA2_86648_c1_seq1:113-769(+)
MYYQMMMQGLAAAGQIDGGVALLAQAEAIGLLNHYDQHQYLMFHTLLEACRALNISDAVSKVQAGLEALGFRSLTPVAKATVQGLVLAYEGGKGGGGVANAEQLCCELRRRTPYALQLQVLPWVFTQRSTQRQQEKSLQLHPEKKLLATMLARGEVDMCISINFNACMDCHEFFKSCTLLRGQRVQLCQSQRRVHRFTDGCCCCCDSWRCKVRLASCT